MFQRFRSGRFVLVSTALAAFALLGGCQAIDRMEAENYRKQCDNLGIARGTPAYDNCMLQQQSLQDEDIQRSMDRSARENRHK